MATIGISITETGQSNLSKTVTLPDGQLDRMVAAYQSAAGSTATRAQVLNYWFSAVVIGRTVGDVLAAEREAATATVQPIAPV